MTKITIRNLKHIKQFEFSIPSPGAYLLTGSNGSGKTSLLTCLSRLTNRNAFQKGFKNSTHKSLDSHRGASVEYNIDNEIVTYTYVEERWAPLPRRNSGLLLKAGYPEIRYIAADAERVLPQQQQFAPRSVRPVSQHLKDAMNAIFSTQRFSELSYINIKRGGQQKAYLIRQPQKSGSPIYYSEKNFSLGELCVLKLLLSLEDIPVNSLLLIDELELALHPKAQVKVFRELEKLTKSKNLTVIFSTHSVSLIKSVPRKSLLFLSSRDGIIECIQGCYPTYALGQISSGEEVAPDTVIWVEDDSAQKCVKAMHQLYIKSLSTPISLPTVVISPLGGFKQILDFMDRNAQVLPTSTKTLALLDEDVKSESLANYEANSDHTALSLFSRLQSKIQYLPWTPEVEFVNTLTSSKFHPDQLKNFFNDQRIDLPDHWQKHPTSDKGSAIRKAAKESMSNVCKYFCQLLGTSNDRIREDLFQFMVYSQSNEQKKNICTVIGNAIHA